MAQHTTFLSEIRFRTILLLLVSTLFFRESFQASETVSIASSDPFALARGCVQSCVWSGSGNLINQLNCPRPYYDSCICREDLRPLGTSWFQACVKTGCSNNAVDLTSAYYIWDSYCTRSAAPASTNAITTSTVVASQTPSVATRVQSSGTTASAAQGAGSAGTVVATVTKVLVGQATPIATRPIASSGRRDGTNLNPGFSTVLAIAAIVFARYL